MAYRIRGALCVLLVAGACCPEAWAQKPLRWKFAPGQKLVVKFNEGKQSQVVINGQPFKTNVDLSFEMLWEVGQVNDEGIAAIRQSFRRAKVVMDSEASGKFQYDSAVDTQPAGPAADVAAAIAPLLKAAFEVSIGPRGEVLSVQVPSETAAHLEAHANGRWKDVISKNGLEKILGQSFAVLPDGPASPGDTWTRTTESQSPLGKLTLTHHYTYDETQRIGETSVEKISVKTDLDLEPAPGSRTSLSSHAYDGSFLFDADQGRMVLAALKQELVSVATYRDQRVEIRLVSNQSMEVAE